jgi:hypothetical protein
MQGRSFSRKFKVEAVRLVRDARAHPGAGARALGLGAGVLLFEGPGSADAKSAESLSCRPQHPN